MANLKAIRSRIKSVQATQKITRAMRLVAAAKVRRAQMRVQAARPFTQAVIRILQDAVRDLAKVDLEGLPLLHSRPVKKVAIIVLSSDRGLCGSYNTNVFRETLARLKTLTDEGKEVALILVGLRAAAFFRSIKVEKLKTYTLLPAIPTVQEAKLISEQACELFINGKVDAVELIGTEFISMLRSRIKITKYLPVDLRVDIWEVREAARLEGDRGVAQRNKFAVQILEAASKMEEPKDRKNELSKLETLFRLSEDQRDKDAWASLASLVAKDNPSQEDCRIALKKLDASAAKDDNLSPQEKAKEPIKEKTGTVLSTVKLFEPSVWEVMERELVPKYVENVIFQALLEAAAAELAARMNAMTNASNNARDLISSLTLVYNKARQSGITQDLLEIVGGAEALKG